MAGKVDWTNRIQKVCECCREAFVPKDTSFWRAASKRFCSLMCRDKQHTGQGHYHWKGGHINEKGYLVISRKGKQTGEHRIIAERILRRHLKRGETVHHINGNKLDNRNSNLLISTRGYHNWLHGEMALRYQKEKFT